jgi:hypothetical protein
MGHLGYDKLDMQLGWEKSRNVYKVLVEKPLRNNDLED